MMKKKRQRRDRQAKQLMLCHLKGTCIWTQEEKNEGNKTGEVIESKRVDDMTHWVKEDEYLSEGRCLEEEDAWRRKKWNLHVN